MDAAGATQWLYEFAKERHGRPTWLIERSSAIVGQRILEGPRERVMGVVRGRRREPVPGGATFPSSGPGEQQQVAEPKTLLAPYPPPPRTDQGK